MPDPRALRSLADRLAAATGPDEDIDIALEEALGGRVRIIEPHCEGRPYWKWSWTAKDGDLLIGSESVAIRPLTASLDAALSLVEAKLPGWHWSIYDTDGCGQRCAQLEPPEHSYQPIDGLAPTPALALLRAFIAALIKQSDVQA